MNTPGVDSPERAHRRLERLYEISKRLSDFQSVERTVAEVLALAAGELPLHSAILIQETKQRLRVIVWHARGERGARLEEAKARARASYGYFAGGEALGRLEAAEERPEELPRAAEANGDLFQRSSRFIVLPLAVDHLRPFGVLQIEGAEGLAEADLVFVNAVVNQLAVALARKTAIDEAQAVTEAERRRYEELVDSLDQAFVWEADARSFQLSYVSARAEPLLGFPRHRWTEEPSFWSRCVHPDDLPAFEGMLRQAAREKRDQRRDHRILTADGRTLWFHTGVHLAAGGSSLQGVSLDITAEKEAEASLLGQLAFTRAVTGSLGEGVLAVDLGGEVTFLNPAAQQLLGVSPEATFEKDFEKLLRFQTAEGAELAPEDGPLQRAIRTGRSIRGDDLLFSSGGRIPFPVSYTAAPLRRGGELSGAVLVFQDIMELKRAESRQRFLSEAGVALASSSREREKTLAAISQLAVPGLAEACFIHLVDEEGNVGPLEPTLALPEPGLAARLLGLMPELDDELAQRRALRTGKALLVTRAFASHPGEPKGESRSLMVIPLSTAQRTLGVMTFVSAEGASPYSETDLAFASAVVRRAALAIDNAQLFEQAQSAIQSRDELLALVSHDLGNPLGNIVMAASLLEHGLPTDRQGLKQRRHAEVIRQSARRMERLIGDLLDIASIEAGKLSVEPKKHEAAALIEEALEMERPLASQKSLHLDAELSGKELRVLCDRERILQVFANLIGNAIKFTPRGGSITVQAEKRGKEVWFSVRDTGPGIPQKQLPHLFDRFWQAKKTRKLGTGLGLSIARGIIEAHRGRIWAESRPGEGSRFWFTLPRA